MKLPFILIGIVSSLLVSVATTASAERDVDVLRVLYPSEGPNFPIRCEGTQLTSLAKHNPHRLLVIELKEGIFVWSKPTPSGLVECAEFNQDGSFKRLMGDGCAQSRASVQVSKALIDQPAVGHTFVWGSLCCRTDGCPAEAAKLWQSHLQSAIKKGAITPVSAPVGH